MGKSLPTHNWRKRMGIAILIALLAAIGLAAAQIDDWSRDLTTNRAATDLAAKDPLLRPVEAPASIEEVRAAIKTFAEARPNWQLAPSERDSPNRLHLLHQTKWLKFTDDVQVRLSKQKNKTRIELHSQSRIGKGDLGQNPRNIRELNEWLRTRLAGGSI